jgi:hypothetical protein
LTKSDRQMRLWRVAERAGALPRDHRILALRVEAGSRPAVTFEGVGGEPGGSREVALACGGVSLAVLWRGSDTLCTREQTQSGKARR